MNTSGYSQSLLAQYRLAWEYYLSNCKLHGIVCKITFGQFVTFITAEQMEKMLQQVGA